MSDVTTKEKIIQINTTNATKNVKSLKTQIKELKEQLAGLEKGTEEYNRVAKELADVNQKQIEINEAMKYSNQDLGATLGNITNVAAGVMGAINGINAVMVMMGADSEEAEKAMRSIQLTMAIIQGMSAMDTARKSLEGLKNAFSETGKNTKETRELANEEAKLRGVVEGTTAAETKESAALKQNSASKASNATTTKTAATAQKASNTATAASVPLLKKATNGIKTLGASLKSFLASNAYLLAIAGAISLISAALSSSSKEAEESKKRFEEWKDMLNSITTNIEQEKVHTDNLISALNDENTSLSTKKKIIDELNKLIPDFNGKINETTEEITYSQEAVNKFNNAIKDRVTYKAYEDRIAQLEALKIQYQHTKNYLSQGLPPLPGSDRAKELSTAISQLQQIDAELSNIKASMKGINLDNVLSSNKTKDAANSTKKLTMTIKELVEEFKKLYKEVVNESFNWNTYKSIFNGFYSETEILMDKIKRLIKVNGIDLGNILSEEFTEAMDNGVLDDMRAYEVNLDFIFDKNKLKELEEALATEEETLRKYSTQEIKVTEKALEAQKKKVAQIKLQIATYNELAETVVKYLSTVKEEEDKYGETATRKKTEALERERELYLTYMTDVKSMNPWAELNRTLATTESELEDVRTELAEINAEEARMSNENLYNKEAVTRYQEIAARREELMERATELERTREETNYQIRLKHIEDSYEAEKTAAEKLNQELENRRSAAGGGVVDYNTDVDKLNNELNAILTQMDNVGGYFDTELETARQHYADLLSTVVEGSDEFIKIERERDEQLTQMTIEREAAITQLEEDAANKRAEITQAEFERKAKIQHAYINTLSTMTSQISSLLGEKMNAYDSDSKEYKKLQIAQATINTISGAFSAFVSGFQSGIPWPGNLIAALALSGLVFATGKQSIDNIKKESLKNSATSTATSGNFGEYDTLSYMNNVDLLDSIQDQRVYVTENDITTTQNRVQVRESEATF
jgi:DNA repair exonuclease SbcCD ATPase subunit